MALDTEGTERQALTDRENAQHSAEFAPRTAFLSHFWPSSLHKVSSAESRQTANEAAGTLVQAYRRGLISEEMLTEILSYLIAHRIEHDCAKRLAPKIDKISKELERSLISYFDMAW